MKISFFKNNTFVTGIDYSKNDDCIAVGELNDQETQDLINGKDYKLSNIDDEKNCIINLYNGEKWMEYLNKIMIEKEMIEKEMIEERKQAIIMELGSLKQQKDGLTLLGEDTKEVDAQITALKTEYKTLIA